MDARTLETILKSNDLPVLWVRPLNEEDYDFEVRFDLRKIGVLDAATKLFDLYNAGELVVDPFRIADGWCHSRKPH